jgi:DNA repair protein RadA/Sms
VVVATVEGARPLLVEVQALCAPSYFSSPRRTVTGADFNRVVVALAVVEKRLGLRLGDMDVYVNVAGGVRVTEPALDLGIALAVVSALRDVAVPPNLVVFGEVGLAGELRAVTHAERRAVEAARLGFELCVLPQSSGKRLGHIGQSVQLRPAQTLRAAVESVLPEALRSRSSQRGGEEADFNAREYSGQGRRDPRQTATRSRSRQSDPDKNAFENMNDALSAAGDFDDTGR